MDIRVFDPNLLEIYEVFVYYDRPLLFSAKDKIGHIYLAILVGEDSNAELWLYSELSPTRYDYVRTGGIDIYTAFKNSESGFVYKVAVTANNVTSELVELKDILVNWLPVPGEFVSIKPKAKTKNIKSMANSALREIINISLEFPNMARHEAPLEPLGKIMANFQELIDYVGMTYFGTPVKLIAKPPTPGSYEINIETAEQINLYGESTASNVLNMVFRLMESGNNQEELTRQLIDLKPQAAGKFLDLVKLMAIHVKETNIEWSSPVPNYGKYINLTTNYLNQMIMIIEAEEIKSKDTYTLIGKLRGIYLDNKKLFLVTTNGEKFWGDIAESILDQEAVQSAQVNREYKIVVEESVELKKGIGKPTTKRSIIMIDPYS